MSDTSKKKRAANKILTQFIREIANEMSDELLVTGPHVEDSRIMTKAEALARYMWKAALGYKEEIQIKDKKTGELHVTEKIHAPDKIYVTLLYDRMEGRVPTVEVKDTDTKPSVAERVSKEGVNRLNNLAKK